MKINEKVSINRDSGKWEDILLSGKKEHSQPEAEHIHQLILSCCTMWRVDTDKGRTQYVGQFVA